MSAPGREELLALGQPAWGEPQRRAAPTSPQTPQPADEQRAARLAQRRAELNEVGDPAAPLDDTDRATRLAARRAELATTPALEEM